MRMKMILCMSLLAVSCLCGCSQNEKVSLSETYDSENISAINMQIDSWQLKIMASADDDVHVTLDGGAAKGAKALYMPDPDRGGLPLFFRRHLHLRSA